jgi:RNA polymerase primary sigma factor
VRLYLKEIGRVELLSSDHELLLAIRMQAARRMEMLGSGRGARPEAEEQAVAVHSAILDDMRTAWKRVIEDARRLRQPEPDLHLILEEARQLAQTWHGDSPSYVRAWLDNGMWGSDPGNRSLATRSRSSSICT